MITQEQLVRAQIITRLVIAWETKGVAMSPTHILQVKLKELRRLADAIMEAAK